MNRVKCGKLLRALRLERDLSIELMVLDMNQKYKDELEKPLNISMVSRWENDKNDPSLRQAVLLCRYFNISLDYLIGITDVRTPADLRSHKKRG